MESHFFPEGHGHGGAVGQKIKTTHPATHNIDCSRQSLMSASAHLTRAHLIISKGSVEWRGGDGRASIRVEPRDAGRRAMSQRKKQDRLIHQIVSKQENRLP